MNLKQTFPKTGDDRNGRGGRRRWRRNLFASSENEFATCGQEEEGTELELTVVDEDAATPPPPLAASKSGKGVASFRRVSLSPCLSINLHLQRARQFSNL
ncbi:unnamed protein product [Brassica oleracea var. botrytis]|uniref:(rape) hypothetical protein n=1 Tax=Brassica napus TaxID=3708 RepID=A0A816UFZ0_BRANA|nr:unnamed protein product [Brassica napus]